MQSIDKIGWLIPLIAGFVIAVLIRDVSPTIFIFLIMLLLAVGSIIVGYSIDNKTPSEESINPGILNIGSLFLGITLTIIFMVIGGH